MVIPFIAIIVVIVGVVYFLVKAGKERGDGRDFGEPGRGTI
jgi:hypothetical protein